MALVAQDLMAAAKVIALDSYAESPFMEHAIEEGLASVGGWSIFVLLFKSVIHTYLFVNREIRRHQRRCRAMC
jgi:hypothetical protein